MTAGIFPVQLFGEASALQTEVANLRAKISQTLSASSKERDEGEAAAGGGGLSAEEFRYLRSPGPQPDCRTPSTAPGPCPVPCPRPYPRPSLTRKVPSLLPTRAADCGRPDGRSRLAAYQARPTTRGRRGCPRADRAAHPLRRLPRLPLRPDLHRAGTARSQFTSSLGEVYI